MPQVNEDGVLFNHQQWRQLLECLMAMRHAPGQAGQSG